MNRKAESETDLGAGKVNSANADSKTEETTKTPFDLKKTVISFFAFFTVEPYIVLYFASSLFAGIAQKPFYIEKACRAELKHPEELCLAGIAGKIEDNATGDAIKAASIITANLSSWTVPLQTGIPAIFILFIGAWSDKTGNRKAMLLLPLIGEILNMGNLLIGTYYLLEWPLWLMGLIEVLITVCTGGIVVALMGCFCYLADITTPETRTFRIGVFIIIQKVFHILLGSLAGILHKKTGNFGNFGVAMMLYIICFIYTLLRIKDVRNTSTEGTFWQKVCEFFHPRNLWETISILFLSRGIQLAQIILIVICHLIMTGPIAGEGIQRYAYTLNIFKIDLVEYTLFDSCSTAVSLIGVIMTVYLFSKLFKIHDTLLGLLATASNVISSVMYALAPNKYWFYAGTAVDMFGNSGGPVIRSLATKLVDPDKVGKICSLLGLADSIMAPIYVPIFNQTFNAYITTSFPGAVFILGAVLTAPDFLIFIILYFLYKKQQRDVVQHPEAKEMHVYDNDITSL